MKEIENDIDIHTGCPYNIISSCIKGFWLLQDPFLYSGGRNLL